MTPSRLLDLFCGAGGAAVGYARAGYEVVGVDNKEQPNYPFEFHHADALTYPLHGFDVIHASPPCQAYSRLKARTGVTTYPNLIPEVREMLISASTSYVIENVMGSPLVNPIKLCGSMFDLAVMRHRLFESSAPLSQPKCNHARQRELWPAGFPGLRSTQENSRVVGVYGTGGGDTKDKALWEWAMGIDWMKTKWELSQSIPPAYTEHIGTDLQRGTTGAEIQD